MRSEPAVRIGDNLFETVRRRSPGRGGWRLRLDRWCGRRSGGRSRPIDHDGTPVERSAAKPSHEPSDEDSPHEPTGLMEKRAFHLATVVRYSLESPCGTSILCEFHRRIALGASW